MTLACAILDEQERISEHWPLTFSGEAHVSPAVDISSAPYSNLSGFDALSARSLIVGVTSARLFVDPDTALNAAVTLFLFYYIQRSDSNPTKAHWQTPHKVQPHWTFSLNGSCSLLDGELPGACTIKLEDRANRLLKRTTPLGVTSWGKSIRIYSQADSGDLREAHGDLDVDTTNTGPSVGNIPTFKPRDWRSGTAHAPAVLGSAIAVAQVCILLVPPPPL